MSLPRPFTPDLKRISFTNPFLHGHSSCFLTDYHEPVLNGLTKTRRAKETGLTGPSSSLSWRRTDDGSLPPGLDVGKYVFFVQSIH